ncbi:MAG: hypothetical protein AAF597_05350 [Bacteroidota bacterium]
MAKTKLTAFSRLLLFLILFLPATYFGVSYYKGEDPIANLKNVLGMDEAPVAQTQTVPTPAEDPATAPATFENVQNLRAEIKNLKAELAIAEERLARCQTENVE